jgi:hypothetical protein
MEFHATATDQGHIMNTTSARSRAVGIVVLAALVVAGSVATGCSALGMETGPPIVANTDLRDKIVDNLKENGIEPKSVTCQDDLVGEVGRTTQCEVEAAGANELLAPIVTVTSVEGSRVNWRLDPALSQKQVERMVTGIVDQNTGVAPDSVSCESGLEGKMDSFTRCDIATGGATLRHTATVIHVENMTMNFVLLPVVTRAEIEQTLVDELARQVGERPDSAACSGDLEAVPGNTVDCTIMAGPETQDFLITVTSLDGNQINYEFEAVG